MSEQFNSGMRELYLTGKGNFRETIAKTLPYKGNRKDTPKPQYYEEIREYMMKHHGAKLINFEEADDAMGYRQMEMRGNSVIVSIDKDMKMIPGWHYNFVKQSLVYVNKAQANSWFFRQLLTGDMTDNILGIKGMGPKTADKLLEPVLGDVVGMSEVAQREYRKAYGEKEWEAIHDEMAQLLWIRRERDQVCPYLLGRGTGGSTSTPKESELVIYPASDGESKETT